jgi:hypothetical protein
VDGGSYSIIFAGGLGGLLDSLLIVFFVVRRTPISITKVCSLNLAQFHQNRMRYVCLITFYRGVDIASIAFLFVQFNNSSSFSLNGLTDSNSKYIGHFTLEAFNCNLKNYTTDVETFNQWCTQGVSYLNLEFLPLLIVSVSFREQHGGS